MIPANSVFSPSPDALSIGLLVLPESSMLSVASTLDPIRAANRFSTRRRFAWKILTADGFPVPLTCGVHLPADGGLGGLGYCEVLIVIAGFNQAHHAGPPVISALRKAAGRLRAVGGIEAGTWVLARAGLLDGHRGTTHWEDLENFADRFGDVAVIQDRFVVSGNRFTAGGASPALDMMLELVRSRCGAPLALQVASAFVYDTVHAASDPQPLVSSGRLLRTEPRVARAIAIMEETLEDPPPVRDIARRIGLSVRALESLFSSTLGVSPGAYFRRLRLETARRLVSDSGLPMRDIAVRCGFASQAAFSRSFRSHHGIAPSVMRNMRRRQI
ncbi:MAG: GlxA family transcriptional regulator [Paracoccaceae bacterium]